MREQIVHRIRTYILPAIVLVSCAWMLKDYFYVQFHLLLAILIAPFVFRVKEKHVYSGRYLPLSLFFLLLYYFLAMKLLLLLCAGSLLLYTIESRAGKTGILPLIFLVCISPALHYLINVFTFDLRLGLSAYAAAILNFSGFPVQCSGNYFILPEGTVFNVDKVCLGLNMYSTGLASITLLVALNEKKYKSSLNILQLGFLLILGGGLLVIANLFRIVLIVLLRSEPGTASHEITGMLSMILYLALPMYFLTESLVKRYGRPTIQSGSNTPLTSFRSVILPLAVLAALLFSHHHINQNKTVRFTDNKLVNLELDGFSRHEQTDGVMAYRRNDLLVYIKPASPFFASDHPPALCWKGSGFEVGAITKIQIAGYEVMMAGIRKGEQTQYTAWWYDNGSVKTNDQLRWRFSKGEPFRIVNLTASSKETLISECVIFLRKRLF